MGVKNFLVCLYVEIYSMVILFLDKTNLCKNFTKHLFHVKKQKKIGKNFERCSIPTTTLTSTPTPTETRSFPSILFPFLYFLVETREIRKQKPKFSFSFKPKTRGKKYFICILFSCYLIV